MSAIRQFIGLAFFSLDCNNQLIKAKCKLRLSITLSLYNKKRNTTKLAKLLEENRHNFSRI